jgi:uncharacterized protein HemX
MRMCFARQEAAAGGAGDAMAKTASSIPSKQPTAPASSTSPTKRSQGNGVSLQVMVAGVALALGVYAGTVHKQQGVNLVDILRTHFMGPVPSVTHINSVSPFVP